MEKLQVELNEYKQRLEQAQQDTGRAKDECLKLTELLGKAEHQLQVIRYILYYSHQRQFQICVATFCLHFIHNCHRWT